MKLYICINQESLPGYIHIDPKPKDSTVPAFSGTIIDLKKIASAGECDEILAPHLLDYIPSPVLDQSLSELASLLHYEGKLIIGGTEINELARALFMGVIDYSRFNDTIFNSQMKKNGIYPISVIKEKLTSLGLVISTTKIDNGEFIIEATRENNM